MPKHLDFQVALLFEYTSYLSLYYIGSNVIMLVFWGWIDKFRIDGILKQWNFEWEIIWHEQFSTLELLELEISFKNKLEQIDNTDSSEYTILLF